jgi:hypothetical protein
VSVEFVLLLVISTAVNVPLALMLLRSRLGNSKTSAESGF